MMQDERANPPDVVQAMRLLFDAYDRFDTRWRIDWGLSATEALVITHLWAAGETSMGALARHAGITSGGATALIDRLERDGYLQRRADPWDRRTQLVSLTEHGRRTRHALDETLRQVAEVVDHDAAQHVAGALTERFLARAEVITEHVERRTRTSGPVSPLE